MPTPAHFNHTVLYPPPLSSPVCMPTPTASPFPGCPTRRIHTPRSFRLILAARSRLILAARSRCEVALLSQSQPECACSSRCAPRWVTCTGSAQVVSTLRRAWGGGKSRQTSVAVRESRQTSVAVFSDGQSRARKATLTGRRGLGNRVRPGPWKAES